MFINKCFQQQFLFKVMFSRVYYQNLMNYSSKLLHLSFDLIQLNWYNFASTVHELLCQWMVAKLDMA